MPEADGPINAIAVDRRVPFRLPQRRLPAAVVLTGGGRGGSDVVLRARAGARSTTSRDMSIPLPPEAPLRIRGPFASLAISRDGRTIAYVAQVGISRQLYVRRADEPAARPIPGAVKAWEAFFSPDGQWLGFVEADQLKKVSLMGGQPLPIADAANLNSGVWADDGHLSWRTGGSGEGRSQWHDPTLAKPAANEVGLRFTRFAARRRPAIYD